jgi:hypothetical protein
MAEVQMPANTDSGFLSAPGRIRVRPRAGCVALALLIHLAACRGGNLRGAADSGGDETSADARARKLALFRQQLITLCNLPTLELRSVLAVLGTRIATQSPHTDRPGGDLAPTELMQAGRAFDSKVESFVEITPAPALRLTFRDLEPALLDFPHMVERPAAHFADELPADAPGRVDHVFGVRSGTLFLTTHPRVPANSPDEEAMQQARAMSEGAGDTLVSIDDLSISKDARDTSGAPTLRQIRERH